VIYFTSDTHFGHRKLIAGGGGDDGRPPRPFASIDEMDEALIANWNSVVKPNDTVFHLGDVSFRRNAETRAIIHRLNGVKTLVAGNHDKGKGPLAWQKNGFDIYQKEGIGLVLLTATRDWSGEVTLIHNPADIFPEGNVRAGTPIVLCGHVHEKWKVKFIPHHIIVNVGVDQWNFTPVSLQTILAIPEVTRV